MADEKKVVGQIPNFTDDNTPAEEEQGVKEVIADEVIKEKVTPVTTPVIEKPDDQKVVVDTNEVENIAKQLQGLASEKEKLLEEIVTLRGQRREIKQEEISKVEKEIDELKDLNSDDVRLIERIVKAKGYVSKDEVQKINFDKVRDEEKDRFLEQYPEYKPENDPNDIKWNALQRELGTYRTPKDPREIGSLLRKAHSYIQKPTSEKPFTSPKKQLEKAAMGGGGGSSVSSSSKPFTSAQREAYSRGGWSDEEIADMEKTNR